MKDTSCTHKEVALGGKSTQCTQPGDYAHTYEWPAGVIETTDRLCKDHAEQGARRNHGEVVKAN